MVNSSSKQPVLIIAGMHRSGTSLTSALLQSAGLDIGQRLLEAKPDNPKGYFENKDFLEFHEQVLQSLGINPVGWTLDESLAVPEDLIVEAQKIIAKNISTTQPWGWKEPRTTLFLNFWKTILPEAKFLLVYRSPWEVLDSLYRRGDDVVCQDPEFALKVWIFYNRAILNFYLGHPRISVLVNANSVVADPKAVIQSVKEKLKIPLNVSISEIYDCQLYHQDLDMQRPLLIKHFFPEAFELYSKLNDVADLVERDSLINKTVEQSGFHTGWLLKDWLDLRRTEALFRESTEGLQKELKSAQALGEERHLWIEQLQEGKEWLEKELKSAQALGEERHLWIEQLQEGKEWLEKELQSAQLALEPSNILNAEYANQIKNLQEAKNQLESHLQATQEILNQLETVKKKQVNHIETLKQQKQRLKSQLQKRSAELQKSHERIKVMESSKFWRLREAWCKLKSAIAIKHND